MKLHLPLSLRSALLSCLVAVSGGLTVCSGTFAVGTAVVAIASASHVMAQDTEEPWSPSGITYPNEVSVSASSTTPLVITQNSAITYTYASTSDQNAGSISAEGFDIKISANGNDRILVFPNAPNATISAKSLWLSQGRIQINGSSLTSVGSIYAQGGQFYLAGDLAATVQLYLGSSAYSGEPALAMLQNVALRLESGANVQGTTEMVEDGAIAVHTGSATLTGNLNTKGFQLTKRSSGALVAKSIEGDKIEKLRIEAGEFRYETFGSVALGQVVMDGGTLNVHNALQGNVFEAVQYQTIETLTLNGNATLKTQNHSGGWKIANIQGESRTLTMDFNGSADRTQYSLIEGGSFSGVLDVKQTHSSANLRAAILGVSSTDVLAGATVNLSQKSTTNGNGYLAFAVGGDVGNRVKILGLNGIAGTYVVSYNIPETLLEKVAIGTLTGSTEARTLELAGSGEYSYNGTIGNSLTIDKTGSGTQVFRNIGDNVTINLAQGNMTILGSLGTGSTINTSLGTVLNISWTLTGSGDVRTATYGKPDYVVGEGTIVSDFIQGVGDLTDGGNGNGAYTILDPTGYTASSVTIRSGLISICDKGNGSGNANFGTIEKFVLNGGGLIVPNSTVTNTYTVSQDIEVLGNGYLRAWGGDNRSANTQLTGAITGNGVLTKTDGGTITLKGDMSGFTGGIAIGKGGLIFDTDATLGSFAMRNSAKLTILNGHQVSVTSGVFEMSAGTNSMVLEQGSNISFNRINFGGTNAQTSTLNLSSTSNGSLTTQKLTGANTINTVINVGTGTALNVTGSTVSTNYATFTVDNTFLITHWQGSSNYAINGTLNMLNCPNFSAVNQSSNMKVNSGGVLNLKGLNLLWRDGPGSNKFNLTLEAGSMMNLGSAGIETTLTGTYSPVNLILNGGTIGILDSTLEWSTAKALTLNGDVSIDTRLYTAATDGKAGTYSGDVGTITLSGAITGEGTLLKKGGGTLLLNSVNKLDVQAGLVGVTGGALTIGNLTAMTEGGGRFLLNLGDGKINAATYVGRVNLNLVFVGGAFSAGGYDVFQGAEGLLENQVDIRYFLDRGLIGAYTVTNGLVHVALSGTSDSGKNITWAGTEGEIWGNTEEDAWTGGSNRFSTGDTVTFDGGGIKNITIVGAVNPGAINISGSENYAFSSGSLTGSGALTKTGTGKLTLATDTVSSWTGDVNLQGGTIAFGDGLGKSNHINVSGMSELEWAIGNTADISSRLVLAENANLTLNTGAGAVAFGTAVATTGTYVKTGSGSLSLNVANTLKGNLTINQGDVILAGGGESGSFNGAVTVNNGGRLVLSGVDATGWGTTNNVSSLTINQGGSMFLNTNGSASQNQTFNNMVLTLNGGSISGVSGAKFDLGAENGRTAVHTLASDTTSTIDTIVNLRQDDGVVFTVADGGAEVDLLLAKNLTGGKTLIKEGDGAMRVAGTTTVGNITVNGGKLVLGNATMGASNITLASGADLVIRGGVFKWSFSSANRTIDNGTITLESDGVIWTNSNWKYHNTLGADTTLKGNGKWITGIPTGSDQKDGWRFLYANGNTADFTGIFELQGSAGASGATHRACLVLNSADGILGGVVKMQGVIFNSGTWATNDDNVVPTDAKLLLKKSMQIGGIEGKGGILETDVTGGVDLTIGNSGNHTFSGSMKGIIKTLTKQGTGAQVFNGDLSNSIAGIETVTVSGGKLSLGSTNYAGNITLSGADSTFTAGKVTIGTGKTLSVSALSTMIDSNLDIAGGSIVLGQAVGNYSVSLNEHVLSLSSTSKTDLSLVLADNLAAGTTIDLFTGVSSLMNGSEALVLDPEALLSDYFNTGISSLAGARLQLSNGKLQLVLNRSTGALVYGLGNNGVWETNEAFEAGGYEFEAGKNVNFNALGSDNSMTVQLKGDLTVGGMTVDAGVGKTYQFAQHVEGGKIVSITDMQVKSGTAELASGVLAPTAATTIKVEDTATLVLNQGATNEHVALSLENGSTLKWGVSNTTDYSTLGGITVGNNSNITLDLNGNNVGFKSGIATSATYTVKGGDLTLDHHGVLGGSVILSDGGNLVLTENAVTAGSYSLNISGTGGLSILQSTNGTTPVTLGGTNTYSGETKLLAGSYLKVSDTSLSTNTSRIVLVGNLSDATTFEYTAAQNATLDREITGTGNLIFGGGQEITLTGANDYVGTTTILSGTTLKVSNTSIGASNNTIVNSGLLELGSGSTAYEVNQSISGTGAITLKGAALTWNTTGKTYTGNTTIQTGSTVSSTGALTSTALGNAEFRLITIESGAKLVLTNALATETWLDNGGGNAKGLSLRGEGTVRLDFAGEVTSDGFIAKAFQSGETLGVLELADGAQLNLSTNRVGKLTGVNTIKVEGGANITYGNGVAAWTGNLLNIAGVGIAGETQGTVKAAALSFTSTSTSARSLSLIDHATVYVAASMTGSQTGAYIGNGKTMTKTGEGILNFGPGSLGTGADTTGGINVVAGTLSFNLGINNISSSDTPYVWAGAISLADGTTFSKHDGYTRLAGGLSATGSVTISSNASKGLDLGVVSGAGTITLERAGASGTSESLILAAENTFAGNWNVTGLWALNVDHGKALEKAGVNFGASASSLQMGVTSVDLVSLEGGATSQLVLKSTLASANLGITGAQTKTFSGSVAGQLTVEMKGTGKQTLNGMLSDGSNYTATQGQLAISSKNQTGSHTFTANGGTLDMQGYTRGASATGSDSFVYKTGSFANLTLTDGMEIKAGDGITGNVILGGTTTLSGGKMVFRLTDAESTGAPAPGYYDLANAYAIASGGSITMGSGSTMLTFIPQEKNLNPGQAGSGVDYVLISGVGAGISDGDLSKFKLNMSASGRTKYTLKIQSNNLVLNVKGAAASLVWQGATGNLWNNEENNLSWKNGSDDTGFFDDDLVKFDTLAGSSPEVINVASNGVKMGGMVVTGSTDYTFRGGSISSSEGNTNAGLTVGTNDAAFTGTLILNTPNLYAGNSVVNSGTVVASNKDAFSNTKLTINQGTIRFGFDGTLSTSSVEMKGGALDATGNAMVDKIIFAGVAADHSLTASTNKTLSLKSSSNTIEGSLLIGSSTTDGKDGYVVLDAGTLALTHGQDVTVESGKLVLKGTTGSYTGANMVLNGGDLLVQGGMTTSLKSLSGEEGEVTIDQSILIFSQNTTLSLGIASKGGMISGTSGLTLDDLRLINGNTTLTGSTSLQGISYAANTLLSVGNASVAGSLVLGSNVTDIDNVNVVNGSLTIKHGDQIGELTVSGSVITQASEASLTVGTSNLKSGASISDAIALTLTGENSWLGENSATGITTSVGTVTLDGSSATAHLGGQLQANEIIVKKGTLSIDYTTAVVTEGITLDGSTATLDMKNTASAIAVAINQGVLSNSSAHTGIITINDTTSGNWGFNMGGLSNSATVEIDNLTEGSSLTNLQNIKLGDSTITLSRGMEKIFEMTQTTGVVSLADGAELKFIASGVINQVITNGSASFGLTNGSLSGLMNGASYKGGVIFDPTLGLYNISSTTNGGNLTLTAHSAVDPDSIYKSTEDGVQIDDYNAMDNIAMVDVNADTIIDLNGATMNQNQQEEGLIIKNLHNTSKDKSTLSITGTADDLVTLNNNLSGTWFNGNIDVDGTKLQINNSNASLDPEQDSKDRELLILGTMQSNAEVALKNGKLVLSGNGNNLTGGLSFVESETRKGLLVLKGNTSIGGVITGAQGILADILVDNATLTLKTGSNLNAWVSGTGGNESISIEGGGTATFAEGARVDKLGLFVDENRTVVIETTEKGALAFNNLNGKGTLTAAATGDMTLELAGKNSSFNGNLDDYEGTIRIKGDGSQTLESSMSDSGSLILEGGNLILKTSGKVNAAMTRETEANLSYGTIVSTDGSKLTLQTTAQTEDGMAANNRIDIDKLTMSGDTLAFNFNLTNELKSTSGVLATVGTGASLSNTMIELNINSVASNFTFRPGEEMNLFLMSGLDESPSVTLKEVSSHFLSKYYGSSEIKADNGYLYITGTTVTGETARFHSDAALSETGRAGAALLDYLYATKNPQVENSDSIASDVLSTLERLILAGNKNEADRIMAGVAGSTVTTLSAAFASSLNNQIDFVRNRMSGMGLDQTLINEDLPGFHAWISGNGGRNDLSNDGFFSGYTLDTWGGTIGVDVDISDQLTIGAAFNASYGDLKASAAESAKGNLDTYSVTAFARVQSKRWKHDFVVAGSTADATLDRTVNYGDGSYSTKGTTNGFGVAALYEASYSIPVGQDKENIFQPLFRMSFTHASMDSYSESQAGDMGLDVGKQDVSYATFGAGARYIANVGQNIYNRNSLLELRALVLQDAGSRRGEADVALSGSAGRTRTVKGAEPGSTGLQIGAGLTIPVQTSSSIFMDVSLDARSKMTTVNGAIGYRVDF